MAPHLKRKKPGIIPLNFGLNRNFQDPFQAARRRRHRIKEFATEKYRSTNTSFQFSNQWFVMRNNTLLLLARICDDKFG